MAGEQQNERERKGNSADPRLPAALLSVKDLVSIVMGLALTHAILTLLTGGGGSRMQALGSHAEGVLALDQISPRAILCTLAVVTAIIRFYHGNNQLLELLFGESSEQNEADVASGGIGVNFIVIMVQSVFFALMSFYVDGSRELIAIFGLLLLLDIFWYVVNLTNNGADREALQQQRAWMLNNLGFLVVLAALYYTKNEGWAVTVGALAILANTVVDFALSWEFYFPPLTAGGERRALKPVR
jgi:hypothetical protein